MLSALVHAAPSVDRVFPLGGQRGTVVAMEITGDKLDRATSVEFDAGDLYWVKTTKAEAKQLSGEVEILPTAALGPHILRVLTADGNTNSVLFNVGQFRAQREQEPNDTLAQATPLGAFPLELYGELKTREETDFFSFHAKAGERLVFDLKSTEYGSHLECKMALLDGGGRRLAFSDDRSDFDDTPYIAWQFEKDGTYYVNVDQYHGPRAADSRNDTYILRVSSLPLLSYAARLGGARGAKTRVALSGSRLDSLTAVYLTKARLAEYFRMTYPYTMRVEVTPDPASGDRVPRINGRMVSRSADHAEVDFEIPADAPVGLWRVWAACAQGVSEGFAFDVSDSPELMEGDPWPAAPPFIVNAGLRQPGERDRYPVTAKAGRPLHFATYSAQYGMPSLDTVLELRDESGKLVAENDDVVNGAASLGNPDSSLFYTPERDGMLTLTVRDRLGRGGAGYPYRLRVSAERPSFHLWTLPTSLVAPAGGELELKVQMAREAGFEKGEVAVWVEGLPDGMPAAKQSFRSDQAWELGADGLQMITPELIFRLPVPETVRPGEYRLRVFGKAEGREVVEAHANLVQGPLTNLFNFTRRPLPAILLSVVER